MSADRLTSEAKRENAAALAAALGINLDEAAAALDICILVTADPTDAIAQHIAQEASALLERTVTSASAIDTGKANAAELIIGAQSARISGTRIYVQVLSDRAVIGRQVQPAERCANIPKILGLLVACYASSAAIYHALGGTIAVGLPEPLEIEFAQLGIDLAAVTQPVFVGRAYLAGAGAIGNGLLWAARYLDMRGHLDIVDDDRVSSGNLNRQIWFEQRDIGHFKVDRLAARAQPHLANLKLSPRQVRLQDLEEKSAGPWLSKLIVGVDSRRARRALQNEFPGEVFDASTTDIREVVVHHNRQPTESACLSCIYEPDEEELSRERHIAEHLGVSVDAVRTERISEESARLIATRFAGLQATELVGTAYDSLFKRLCAESALKTLEGKRVVAPFACVSVLAGTLLALELVRRHALGSSPVDNYWRLSPWHPPLARRRVRRPRQPNCAFCGNPVLRKVNESLW